MRETLLDENVPVQLRHWLRRVRATTVEYMGWKGLRNGELMRVASGRFEVFVTTDRPLACGEAARRFGVVLLSTNAKDILRGIADEIDAACAAVEKGSAVVVPRDRPT